MLRVRMILVMVLMANFGFAQADSTRNLAQAKAALSRRTAARNLFINTVILDVYFAPYSFIFGVALGGQSIVGGKSLNRANAVWATTSIAGMAMSWLASNALTLEMREMLKGVGPEMGANDTRIYRIFSGGLSTSSILDFQAESVFMGDNGKPQWEAGAAEVKTTISFPAVGRRIGVSGRHWGGEFETSIVAHHTSKQTVYYDATGFIRVPGLGEVPLALNDIEIPDRFLMIHSLFMGANVFVWLPKVKVEPYVGLGTGVLINSVQSQYPGPANLIQEDGSLALDATTVGFALRGLLGFRVDISDRKFVFAEFRPARYYYTYESGTRNLAENDRFTLQIFEVQMGLGFYIN